MLTFNPVADFKTLVHGIDSMGDQIACSVFPMRDEVEFQPLFSEHIIDVLNQGIKDRQHPFNGVVEGVVSLECHSLLQEGGMRLAISMEGL